MSISSRIVQIGGILRDSLTFLPSIMGYNAARVRPRVEGRPLVVMLVISDLRVDPRVRSEAQSLARAGYNILIVYPDMFSGAGGSFTNRSWDDEEGLTHEIPDYGPGIRFMPLPRRHAEFRTHYPFLMATQYAKAIAHLRPFAVHCHDASTVLPGLDLAWRSGAHWICDFHEWSSENIIWSPKTGGDIPNPPHVRFAFRMVERLAIRRASAVITVCDTIGSALWRDHAQPHSRPVQIIRNIPSARLEASRHYGDIRDELGLPADSFVVLYQGGVGPTRQLEPVIEAVAHCDPHVHFIIRGPGMSAFGAGYRALAAASGVTERVHCIDPVPSNDVIAACRGADCGLLTLIDFCKNFTAALPNKLFEYSLAGLPILAADFPEIRGFVESHAVGRVFQTRSPASISAAITWAFNNPEALAAIRARAETLKEKIDPEREWGKLVKLYDGLDRQRGASP